jgi:hypothetical protein
MQVSGTGDVVLTDIKETSASLIIDGNIVGRLSIRDSDDYLVAEITKTAVKPMELGLEPGLYRITLQRGDNFSRAEVLLSKDQKTPLAPEDFKLIAAAQAAARGDTPAADPRTDSEEPEKRNGRRGFNFQFVPGVTIVHAGSLNSSDHLLLGIVGAHGDGLVGAGFAPIGLSNAGMVRGAQAAGIYNIIDGNLQGVQGAGIFNIANKSMTGAQGAGIFNKANESITGAQGAGIFNMTNGSITGAQGAGIFNITGESISGAQGAGIFNMTNGSINGAQAAGIFNMDGVSMTGVQAAGIFNMTDKDVTGVQAAGIFNMTGGDVTGVQAAGIFNLARGNFYGLQAGLVNIGGEGRSVQAGLVNISQNENVFPIGLVNIVKGGILHPAVYVDSMGFLNFSLRSGSRHFYSILGVGAQKIYLSAGGNDKAVWGWNKDDALLVCRAGVGFEFPIKSFFINVDVTSGSVLNLDTISKDDYDSSVSFLSQARLTAGYKIFEHLGVFAGISYDYVHLEGKDSPNPTGRMDCVFGWGNSRHINKLGFFAGLQF